MTPRVIIVGKTIKTFEIVKEIGYGMDVPGTNINA